MRRTCLHVIDHSREKRSKRGRERKKWEVLRQKNQFNYEKLQLGKREGDIKRIRPSMYNIVQKPPLIPEDVLC